MKRIIRDRHLTSDEAAKNQLVRERVAEELPALVERHHEHMVRLRLCYNHCVSIGLFEKGKGTVDTKVGDDWEPVRWFEREDFKERLESVEVNALVDAHYKRLADEESAVDE